MKNLKLRELFIFKIIFKNYDDLMIFKALCRSPRAARPITPILELDLSFDLNRSFTKFGDPRSKDTQVIARTDTQTDRQTDRQTLRSHKAAFAT
jgi:hypothetical protein